MAAADTARQAAIVAHIGAAVAALSALLVSTGVGGGNELARLLLEELAAALRAEPMRQAQQEAGAGQAKRTRPWDEDAAFCVLLVLPRSSRWDEASKGTFQTVQALAAAGGGKGARFAWLDAERQTPFVEFLAAAARPLGKAAAGDVRRVAIYA
eukprot:7085214-Prymnesium_polylepis.1